MAVQPFSPLSKEDVAQIFGVTPRTIENWVEHEGLPAPASIGNRVFWHPDIFYEWLDGKLRQSKPSVPSSAAAATAPKRRHIHDTDLDQLRSRSQLRVANIEAGANPANI